ncbi:MAG: hypothetical protein VB055_02270 [Oscillospiraceae bacterium]|nr:hypothetical protein [Oscillospiraceae bacterium]
MRKVLCPICGMTSKFCGEASLRCWACGRAFAIEANDRQNLRFVRSSDGYHCWQSQPTAYHTIYACEGYPDDCGACIHAGKSFCIDGRIDFRLPANVVIEGVLRPKE